jgi:phospholipase D3/4
VASGKGARVRVLISKWAHTSALIEPNLAALAATAKTLCSATSTWAPSCGAGSLEVRLFEVPGWNSTEGVLAQFPQYSRVNHAKFIVSDTRLNIGTSNMEWGYFWNVS